MIDEQFTILKGGETVTRLVDLIRYQHQVSAQQGTNIPPVVEIENQVLVDKIIGNGKANIGEQVVQTADYLRSKLAQLGIPPGEFFPLMKLRGDYEPGPGKVPLPLEGSTNTGIIYLT
tara:strand:- start:8 stop:361 length:354 start_codon:yes stop_codon:yes gene_type:complete